jgi:formiminotetrahydrofolate cyclodeaminase
MNGELSPVEVLSVAEARAAAIVDMFPEQPPATAAGTVAALAQAVNTLTAMVNELALINARQSDELDYMRRRIERLEQSKTV